jgi:hypothetical protein
MKIKRNNRKSGIPTKKEEDILDRKNGEGANQIWMN